MKKKFYTDFSVKLCINQNWQMKDVHFHDLFEIYYSFTNNIKYLIDGKLYAVNRGDLFIFNMSFTRQLFLLILSMKDMY